MKLPNPTVHEYLSVPSLLCLSYGDLRERRVQLRGLIQRPAELLPVGDSAGPGFVDVLVGDDVAVAFGEARSGPYADSSAHHPGACQWRGRRVRHPRHCVLCDTKRMTDAQSSIERPGETAREEAVNVLLGQLLRDRGVPARAERRSRGDAPDVRFELASGVLS